MASGAPEANSPLQTEEASQPFVTVEKQTNKKEAKRGPQKNGYGMQQIRIWSRRSKLIQAQLFLSFSSYQAIKAELISYLPLYLLTLF